MFQAALFGLVASSALVIGAALGTVWVAPKQVLAVALAFAAGALISALAFELIVDADKEAGRTLAGAGFALGAVVFVLIDSALDKRADPASPGEHNAGLPLFAAVTLDGVPENLALGVALVNESPYALLLAIFFSNLPESFVGAAALRDAKWSRSRVMLLWIGCGVLLALAVVAGRGLLSGADPKLVGTCLAFAGGAVLASLADTLMPRAYSQGGPWVAMATALGFFVSFILAHPA